MMASLQQLIRKLYSPVEIMPLVFFRVAFGVLMLWEVWRYFHYDRVNRYYIDALYYFSYMGFDWLRPLPGDGMIWLFYGLGILSILISIGLFYRLSMVLFFLGFTYMFLLDQTQYLNHFYLISLFSGLMIFLPLNRKYAFDVVLWPKLHRSTVPAWTLWTLRGQMTVVYVFGGIAKLNGDWLRGEPMRDWLAARTDFPLLGRWFTEEWAAYVGSYGGLLFDLLIVPVLLWRRTRIPALIVAVGFHISNDRLFNIGIFPWFAIAATLLFLPPHWFRLWKSPHFEADDSHQTELPSRAARYGLMALGIYFLIQILFPLRHFLYAGDVNWTEEGHNLSWHMRLRDKESEVQIFATDPAGSTWPIAPLELLNLRQFQQMAHRPDMLLQFAQYLSATLNTPSGLPAEIRMRVNTSLNGRPYQLLIDPSVNLAVLPRNIYSRDWVLPLVQPLKANPALPTLLISRRHEGVLQFINMTDTPFPLANLRLHTDRISLDGAAFNLAELPAESCVIAYSNGSALEGLTMICNEEQRLENAAVADLWREDFTISLEDQAEVSCKKVVCVVRSG